MSVRKYSRPYIDSGYDRDVTGWNPSGTTSKLWQVLLFHFATSLSDETLKAADLFYLAPGEVEYPTQWVNV